MCKSDIGKCHLSLDEQRPACPAIVSQRMLAAGRWVQWIEGVVDAAEMLIGESEKCWKQGLIKPCAVGMLLMISVSLGL